MVTKCGPCITKCLGDEDCKACITALDEIDTRDQVASYRTVVSYESELLRDFSLCILQKNNIFECSATIPQVPKVEPMKTVATQDVEASFENELEAEFLPARDAEAVCGALAA